MAKKLSIEQEIRKSYKDAIKKFGAYTAADKGCHEIMDIGAIAETLIGLSEEEAAKIVDSLSDCEFLNESLICAMDSADEGWFESFHDLSSEAQRCY
jgi:hypothetical protein